MSYTKTTWVSGEQITATKLNNAENGIENLDQRVENLEGHTGAFDRQSGSLLHFQDSINAQIRDVILYGKSTQNGTPTPSAPVAINTAGDGGTLGVVSNGKNFLIIGFTSTITNTQGVTLTPLGDGSLKINGSVTSNVLVTFNMANGAIGSTTQNDRKKNIPNGTYKVSGMPSGLSLQIRGTNSTAANNQGTNIPITSNTFTIDDTYAYNQVRLHMNADSSYSNVVFTPIISRVDDTTTEGYSGTIYPVTVPETGLPGIAVSSGGNYTDSTGQQWICDTVDLGRGAYTKRVHVVTFNGSEGWEVSNAGTSNWYYSLGNAGQLPQCPSIATPVLSSHYPFATISNSNTNQGICAGQGATLGFVRVRYGSEDTKENFKTWLASNNLTLAYPMTNPIETALTDEQVAQLRVISTLKDETYMYNDGGSGMYVENYVNEKDLTDHLETTVDVLTIKPTATGAIASFADGSDGLPVKDLTIAINPKQAGSGDPSPSNVRAISGWTGANVTRVGKNLLNPELYGNPLPYTNRQVTYSKVRDGVYHANGTATGGASYWNVSFKIGVDGALPAKHLVGKNLYFSTNVDNIACTIGYFKADGTTSGLTNGSQLPNDAVGLRCYVSVDSGVSIDTDFSVQLEIGSTGTALEPYAATTYPITFPSAAGTVYGGLLDVTTGVLTVDRACVTLDGSQNVSASNDNRFYVTISEARKITNSNQSTDSSVICDKANSLTWSKLASGTIVGDSMCCAPVYGNGVAFRWSTITSAADWKSYFTSNPTQFSYALNTTVAYQCTPTEVATLLGANNIYADTGDSTVTYLADTKLYIDNAIAALQALVLEN